MVCLAHRIRQISRKLFKHLSSLSIISASSPIDANCQDGGQEEELEPFPGLKVPSIAGKLLGTSSPTGDGPQE